MISHRDYPGNHSKSEISKSDRRGKRRNILHNIMPFMLYRMYYISRPCSNDGYHDNKIKRAEAKLYIDLASNHLNF